VCIGGDRASGYEYAKEQLLRELDDTNPNAELAALEQRVLEASNKLDIGPMGFGGRLTVGGWQGGGGDRPPGSFFVSIAYMCWAYRRRGVVLDANGEAVEWLYQEPEESFEYSPAAASEPALIDLAGAAPGTKIIQLKTPLTDAAVRGLKAGDVV